jgi:hypothetical protein
MKRFTIALATALLSVPAFAADLTGTWVGIVRAAAPGGQAPGGGQGPLPFIVHISQKGDAATGSMDGIGGAPNVEIQNGKVDGNVLTFVGVRKINNMDVTFNYTATLNGESLEFKIERAGAAALASTTTRLTTAF